MYKCRDCKAIYKDKVDYCECGNNSFEEFEPKLTESQKRVDFHDDEPVKERVSAEILPFKFMPGIIFSLCCIFALCFVLFIGPEPSKRETPQTSEKVEKKTVQNIPDINKFWDSTPAYTLRSAEFDDIEFYKESLRKSLLSRLNAKDIEASGACDIQFVIDKNGNIKKKKVYQNTANKVLINAAKKMLSSFKVYNAPPKEYDGEPITLELKALEGHKFVLRYKE